MASHAETTTTVVNAKLFRFKFSEEMSELLLSFSQQHKFCNKDDFKDQWEMWTSEHVDAIYREKERLETMGYDGNIVEKMFKSVKYYYCKRNEKYKNVDGDKGSKDKKKKYIKKNNEFITIIDDFIDTHMEQRKEEGGMVIKTCKIKPSHFWNLFYNEYGTELTCEVERIQNESENRLSNNEAMAKIRKLFNNRYFIKVRCHSNAVN